MVGYLASGEDCALRSLASPQAVLLRLLVIMALLDECSQLSSAVGYQSVPKGHLSTCVPLSLGAQGLGLLTATGTNLLPYG